MKALRLATAFSKYDLRVARRTIWPKIKSRIKARKST
jgi:hypothetical protein